MGIYIYKRCDDRDINLPGAPVDRNGRTEDVETVNAEIFVSLNVRKVNPVELMI